MCGRFAFFRWSRVETELPGFPKGLDPHWNLSPGAQVLFMREEQGTPCLGSARWGLTAAWMKDFSRTPAHARLETLATQPMFQEPYRTRRGLVLANGFYEWRGAYKRPYWMTSEASVLHFAALWEPFPVGDQVYYSVALVTQPVADQRRPILIEASSQAAWLSPDTPLDQIQDVLAQPGPALRERPLAKLVNDPKLDAPECLTPA